ncbi:MAG: hypothetical protein LBM93_07825 [Oscillospiraceae bacterium]|nr:hypothetical protein [Oscillospiraceae bacterium]
MKPKEIYPFISICDDFDVAEIAAKLSNTEKIAASIGNFGLLPIFEKLKRVVILCGNISENGLKNLYRHKNLESLCFESGYFSDLNDKDGVIDLNNFRNLSALVSSTIHNVANLSDAENLKTLSILKWNDTDLSLLSKLKMLDSLSVGRGSLTSLVGIENSKIECLYVSNQKRLFDISILEQCKETVKALRIDFCPNVKDFSVIKKLKNLELLSITGNKGELPNLDFIGNSPNLQFFVTDYNVLDGNIKPLIKLPYASILKNRRHYNLKDNDLKRVGNPKKGNENIPEWRRIFG